MEIKKSMSLLPDLDVQRHWEDHAVVTDAMVACIKQHLGLKHHWGIQIVTEEQHEKAGMGKIPPGKVAWLKVDRRLPRMDGYFLNASNVLYTFPNGTVEALTN